MNTQKNHRTQIHEGDSCNVNKKLSYEEHLLEEHPQHLLENHPQQLIGEHHEEAAPIAAVGEPIKGAAKTHWWAWGFAALVGLFIAGLGLYFGSRNGHDRAESERYAYTSSDRNGSSASGSQSSDAVGYAAGMNGTAAATGSQAVVEDYIYYFENDKSAVVDNRILNQAAEKIQQTGADVVVTAYASQVGSDAYNKNLSAKRARNVADYLIAHGVSGDHIKVVSNGETTGFGDNAHNRRANIHVTYPG